MFGIAVHDPLVGAGAVKSGFGGDDQALRIGIESFGDNFFADAGAVGISGIDEIDAESDGAAENFYCFGAVFWVRPRFLCR
jgi:hypothetical protein